MTESSSESRTEFSTLVELLRRRALHQGEQRAYTFLADGETEEVHLTYRELDEQARAIGALLQDLGASNQRALLLYPACLEYVAAFFGCLYAGVTAVPAYPPRPNRPMPRIRTIVADGQATIALTTGAILSQLGAQLDQLPDLQALAWRSTDELAGDLAEQWRDPGISGETLAFLQYTSGSTAAPKGVMVSHGNLLHNQELIKTACRHSDQTPFVSWLPLYHDLGLIGNLIQALYIGAPCTLMSPVSFLQRPVRWLHTVTRYQAHTSGGPNFAYDLCVRKIAPEELEAFDLSSWKVAFNGAEPVRHETLDRFAEKFAPCGFRREAFYPCYGMAETTLIVSGGTRDEPPVVGSFRSDDLEQHRAVEAPEEAGGRSLVGCGRALGELEVKIVHPETLVECPSGEVGEIWVQGPSVCQGYWNRPEETASTFRENLADSGEDPFLRTGDLGFLHRGELYITGRLKDLIIVRGQNHYPQDVEATVEQSHPALRPGCSAAFSVDVDDEERLVVVQEVRRQYQEADFDEIVGAVRQAVADGHELQLYALALIKPGSLPKTTSGKIQRRKSRQDFQGEKLALVAVWREAAGVDAAEPEAPVETVADMERWLVARLAARVGVAAAEVDPQRSVLHYGLDSLAAIELMHEIEGRFGGSVALDSLFEGISIAQLARDVGVPEATKPATAELIPAAEPVSEAALSHGQRALWFLQQLEPESSAYNIASAVAVRGELDTTALRTAFETLVDRHPALRTTFAVVDGEPVQRISESVEVALAEEDAAEWSEATLHERLTEAANIPFDLESGPLLQLRLFTRAAAEPDQPTGVLLIVAHHIVSDFWSLAVLAQELGQAYGGAVAQRPAALEPLALHYTDYVRWQNEMLAGAAGEKLLAYWREQLAGELPAFDLVTDRPRPPVQTYAGGAARLRVSAEVTAGLKALGRERDTTLFVTLLAAFQVLLHRFSGQPELLIGTPVAGRHRAHLAGIVGYFVNPVVLRSEPADDPGFEVHLARTRRTVLAAFEHQEQPFATLVERLQPVRDPSRSPLFQVMFALQTAPRLGGGDLTPFAVGEPGARVRLGDLEIESVALEQRIAQFDLTLSMGETGETLAALLDYNLDLYDFSTVARMTSSLATLLAAVAADPERRISGLPILAAGERFQLLAEWNDTAAEASPQECVHEFFAARAVWRPNAIAVLFEGERLTYRDLDWRANQLARHLRSLGVGPDQVVGLYLERSVEMMIGTIGILKAGGAYVPLDPEYPEERVATVLEDAGVRVAVTRDGLAPHLASLLPAEASIVSLDGDRETIAAYGGHDLDYRGAPAPRGENAACLIYTSGSTGKPKGVVIEHRNLVHLVASFISSYHPNAEDRILPVTAITSASFVGEIMPVLAAGGAVVMPNTDQLLNFVAMIELISRRRVTILSTVPSIVAGLNAMKDQLPKLRLILSGGEALPPGDVDRLLETAEVVNGYGLTETTICSTIHWLTVADFTTNRTIPIGRPLVSQQLFIVDRRFRPQPIGCPGEILIGGRGVARGYLQDPALTAASFVPSPCAEGGRLYRTGDLARWLPNGLIEYLGRIDHQVKIRGYRIELGEIEAVLGRHSAVQETTVAVRDDEAAVGAGEKRLVAWVVLRQGKELNISELLAYLREKLPDYMVPAAVVPMDALPLLPNGKVDENALPAPEKLRPELEAGYAAPASEIERTIVAVWQEELAIDRVGIHDNFFDLGGHSLLLARVHAKLRERLAREVSLIELFKYPTVSALARFLSPEGTADSTLELSRERAAARLKARAEGGTEIAVVGMSGRFPGARCVEELWSNLLDGVESITFFTDEELEAEGIDPALISHPNYIKAKGILGDVDMFDAAFFGHNPRVAELTDPQHRIFLECAWEALEHAGYDVARHGGRVGVFAGQSMNTYWLNNLYDHIDLVASVDSLEAAIGNDKDSLTTEVSYRLNLKGPSVNIQSSSSTSLTAVHYACQSLLNHECEMAISGGSSIHLPERSGYLYHEGGTTSPDGHCRTFDAEAKGFVSGHGVGVVVLKRLEDALADGDRIYGVIKGSACNNDGSGKVSYMAPSIDGHAEVVATAQAVAGVSAETIGYYEAHGTGTLLGDPIEIAALTQAFRATTDESGFCAIGSLKTNIGHLDTAAGVCGMIKAVLCLDREMLPPSLHFRTPNPKIDFANSPFVVNDRLRPWSRNEVPRRAGVSSLGMGGTNTHVVLEEAPQAEPSGPSRSHQLLLLSARSAEALDNVTGNLLTHLGEHPELDFADVAYTLQVGRKVFQHRRMLVCQDRDDAVAALDPADPERVFTTFREAGNRPVAFLFSGQGAQYVNMGRELYDSEAVFRREVDRCAELLRPHLAESGGSLICPPPGEPLICPPLGEPDIRRLIFADDQTDEAAETLRQTSIAQPALFVIEYALARLWMEWGVRPKAMIGHSIGEYVAACLAGVFSLEDALALVAARGRLMQKMPKGDMLAVPLPEDKVVPLLGDSLSLAAVNRPSTCVVSGRPKAVAGLELQLAGQGLECRYLHTSHAFHSTMMVPILEPFVAEVKKVRLRPPEMLYISNVTGTWIRAEEATDPDYWARQLRSTVRFAAGIAELLREPERIFLEIGPGNALATAVGHHPDRNAGQVALPSLRHPKQRDDDVAFMLHSLGRLWLAGVEVDWLAHRAQERRLRVPLPTYPFERQRFWVEPGKMEGKKRRRKKLSLADWFYVPVWKQSLPPVAREAQEEDEPPAEVPLWLVFVNSTGLGFRIVEHLAAAGQRVVTVSAKEEYAHVGSAFAIRPGHSEDYEKMLEALDRPPHKILHLWTVTRGGLREEEGLDRCFYSLLFLAQALGRRQGGDSFQIAVVSDQLHQVTGEEDLSPVKATLLGPCRVMHREYSNISCRSIDIGQDSTVDRGLVERILREFEIETGDPAVAFRGAHRWIQTFEPVPLQPGGKMRLRRGGVYLITGGLGGMGLELADHLARTVRARLVLVGRTSLPPRVDWPEWKGTHEDDPVSRQIRRIQTIEGMETEVLVLRANVTDWRAMMAVKERALEEFGEINGIIHAAGVPSGGLMQFKTREICAEVLAPKVQGTLVLEEVFQDMPLDFLALFSSVTSILAQLGQADYAAANAFLDAFAQERTARGGGFTAAINWDAWREVGMAVTTEVPEELRGWRQESLREGISPDQGVEAFDRIVRSAYPQVAVSRHDFQERVEHHFAARLPQELKEIAEPQAAHARPNLANAYVTPEGELEERLAGIWQELLGIDEVGVHDNFFELGGNSLIGLKVTSRIKAELRTDISPVALFEGPTVSSLAKLIGGEEEVRYEKGRSRGERRKARRLRKHKVRETP
ncbi:MAG: amino acid adenylation domain-containing protein [bacterium]|nr:amino acid adenylation domain-containing protein [bacterium]